MWLLLSLFLFPQKSDQTFTQDKQHLEGFYDLYWDEAKGSLFLGIDRFDEPFLFIDGLATGLGSNDVGLDRGQLGENRIVSFKRVGNQVFLVQPSQRYRANSDNALERRAVAESFASATLWGTTIHAEENGVVFVDLSSFLFRDEKKVTTRLQEMGEGSYSLEKSRSFYYLPRTKAFPDNTEIECSLTFKGRPKGRLVRSVTPTAESFTLRQHYSFVRLPKDGFKPRAYHPRSGGFSRTYRDMAAPLDAELDVRLLNRHRLEAKNPDAEKSEVIEPIVYFVDSGAPAQIREALIEGASWWNQAFEAAGFINAFHVEVLPADADPMDVRYNTIQWVHRSTRGWSYGGSVTDPRTGEIIKGHVTLGSLRVRQDRLLFEGMIPLDENGQSTAPDGQRPLDLALARIRQLSAHEVGHTLGLAHNFAASIVDRASVMDYPAPLVLLKNGKLDFSSVYGVGIGEWDKLSISYLYGIFKDEKAGLASVLNEAKKKGVPFISDNHSRTAGNMHPNSHLWENGLDAQVEFERVLELRNFLLKKFSTRNLKPERMLAQLEEVLVPVYLHHRYQLDANVKCIGGADFDYGENDGQSHFAVVSRDRQERALALTLQTLDPAFLILPKTLQELIPPRPPGYRGHREMFGRRTGNGFDALAMAETSADLTLGALLIPERLNRVHGQWAHDSSRLGVHELLDRLLKQTVLAGARSGTEGALHRQVNFQVIDRLSALLGNTNLREEVRAEVHAALASVTTGVDKMASDHREYKNHYSWLKARLQKSMAEDDVHKKTKRLPNPPGSPIGSESY